MNISERTQRLDRFASSAARPPAPPATLEEAPRRPPHEPFIVTCPSCGGSGLVHRDGSQVHLVCRLCWHHGVVARIVADKYARTAQPAPLGRRSDPDR